MYNELTTERMELMASIHPDLGQGRYDMPWFSMQNTHKLLAIAQVGDMGQGATFDMQLQEATDAAGTGAKAIAGKAITQLTQAGGDGDDDVSINLKTEEMDAANDFDFVRVTVWALNANINFNVIVLGDDPRYAPVDNNWTEAVA